MFRHPWFVAPALVALVLPLEAFGQTTQPALATAQYQIPPARYPAPIQTKKTGKDADASPAAALRKTIPELKFTEVPLEDAINRVADLTGANIHVNWRALELLNVTRQMPTSVSLRHVTARRALRALIESTGAGDHLTYYVDEGVIEVTTKEIADSKLFTRVYPVEDLIAEVPNFVGPTFNLQSQSNTASGGGGGGSGGQSLFQGGRTTQGQEQTTKQQRADSLVTLIVETVRPEIWKENGGTASVRYFNGHLIVTAPRSVHETLGGSVDSLR